MSYQLLKTLHLFGVVLLLGNAITTAVWKTLADRTRLPRVIAHSQRVVAVTDCTLTLAGAAMVFLTGHLLAGGREAVLSTPWLASGYALFIASGLLWVFVLIPIQWKQARLARSFQHLDEVPLSYLRLSRWWMWWGSLATLLPLGNLYLMVSKPG